MDANEFGSYILKKRNNRGLTTRKLDQLSGVSNSYISQMERGARGIPSPEILKKLSVPLGIDYMDLMIAAGYVKPFIVAEMQGSTDEITKLRNENKVLRQTIKELSKLI